MPRRLTDKDRSKIVGMAAKVTERECRKRKIRCWKKDEYAEFTAEAQSIFNRAYDHFEATIKDFLSI